MPLADYQIERMALDFGMIEPFRPEQISRGVISSGVSSHGYDATVGREVKWLNPPHGVVIDPKNAVADHFEVLPIHQDEHGEFVVVPPLGFVLTHTEETFRIPRTIIAECLGKSTYARNALSIFVSPLESEWAGQVTLEYFNAARYNPSRLYVGEGGCQFVFHQGMSPKTSYADRKGKYMDQVGVTLAKVKEASDATR